MVRIMVLASTSRLNYITALNGVSDKLGSTTILIGRPAPNYNVMTKISFGAYVQVNDKPSPTNGQIQLTTGAIALYSVWNEEDGYYVMSLSTGDRLSRRSWKELPMSNDVIVVVESMSIAQDQPLLGEDGLLFKWRPGVLFDNEEPVEVDFYNTYDANKY